jgi:hypothetical protein
MEASSSRMNQSIGAPLQSIACIYYNIMLFSKTKYAQETLTTHNNNEDKKKTHIHA